MYMLKRLKYIGQIKQDILNQVKVGQIGQCGLWVGYNLPTSLFTTYLPTYLSQKLFLIRTLILLVKWSIHTLLVKKPPQSQQTSQNQLVQNDEMIFLTPIKIGFLKLYFPIKKPNFLVVIKKLGKFSNHMNSKDTKYHMVVTRQIQLQRV